MSLYRYVYIIENFIVSVTIYHSEVNCTRSCLSRKIYVLFSAYLFVTLYMNSSLLVRLETGRKSLLQIMQNQCACKVLSLMQLSIARIVWRSCSSYDPYSHSQYITFITVYHTFIALDTIWFLASVLSWFYYSSIMIFVFKVFNFFYFWLIEDWLCNAVIQTHFHYGCSSWFPLLKRKF